MQNKCIPLAPIFLSFHFWHVFFPPKYGQKHCKPVNGDYLQANTTVLRTAKQIDPRKNNLYEKFNLCKFKKIKIFAKTVNNDLQEKTTVLRTAKQIDCVKLICVKNKICVNSQRLSYLQKF